MMRCRTRNKDGTPLMCGLVADLRHFTAVPLSPENSPVPMSVSMHVDLENNLVAVASSFYFFQAVQIQRTLSHPQEEYLHSVS
jgi:hypothetical protein